MTPQSGARLNPQAPVLGGALPAFSLEAEQYRKVAVQVEERTAEAAGRGFVLAVMSPDPAAGKTLTSLNLGIALARGGERRVLLLECDLWQPTLDDYVGFNRSLPGLFQVLVEDVPLDNVLISIDGPGVHIVPAGVSRAVDNLMADAKMKQLVSTLRASYDLVIVDSPPFMFASAHSLATLADAVLIVVRGGRTRRPEIESMLSSLGPDKVLGMLLNDVSREGISPSRYGVYKAHENQDPDGTGGGTE